MEISVLAYQISHVAQRVHRMACPVRVWNQFMAGQILYHSSIPKIESVEIPFLISATFVSSKPT